MFFDTLAYQNPQEAVRNRLNICQIQISNDIIQHECFCEGRCESRWLVKPEYNKDRQGTTGLPDLSKHLRGRCTLKKENKWALFILGMGGPVQKSQFLRGDGGRGIPKDIFHQF